MPSERIYATTGDIDVRVAWGQTGSVQVATLVRETDSFRATKRVLGIVNEWLVEAGEQPLDLDELTRKIRKNREERGELPVDPYFDGYHATLDDWPSINELIKVLRRARDTVHGRPE